MTLSELRDDYGLPLGSMDVSTVAGLILAQTGTVPASGVTVHVQGVDLTVEEVSELKITRVRLRRIGE